MVTPQASVQCFVPGCTNTSARLACWEKEQCQHHRVFRFSQYCDCAPPFEFFQFPTLSINPGMRQQWIAVCQEPGQPFREPLRSDRICSKHFHNGKPGDHPVPVLFLMRSENVSEAGGHTAVTGVIIGFDPDRSLREMRKINTRISQKKKRAAIYNERGVLVETGKDWCDCLQTQCPGCHYPCPKCDSPKCGLECRNHRAWYYQHVEIEGSNKTIEWPTCPTGI